MNRNRLYQEKKKILTIFYFLNIFRVSGQPYATLTDPTTNADIGKALVADGILLVEKRRERKLTKLVIFSFNYFYFVFKQTVLKK